KAISLFRKLKLKGLQPNNLTFPFIAKACAKLSNLKCSQLIHCHIEKSPFRPDIYVQTAIVDMYVKCNRLDEALKVFDRMPDRDVASWNVIILGFAQMGFTEKVLGIFREMRFGGIQPDSVTLMGLTEGMLQTKNLSLMKAIHSFGIRVGIDGDVSVANTWVAGYAKCGDLGLAELVFDGIEEGLRTVVSWNSMIAGYANFEKFFDGFTFYKRMLIDGLRPEVSTIVSLLSSCVQTGAPSHGRLIHCHGILSGCDLDVCFNNTLISMYSKCGDTDSARFVFDGMSERTCVSWTVMIRGYANKGDMDEALALFYAMKIAGEKPDLVTVQSLISVMGKKGKIRMAMWLFSEMRNSGCKPDSSVYNALITAHLHSKDKAKALEKALGYFNKMKGMERCKPNIVTYNVLLRAFAQARNVDQVNALFKEMDESIVSPDIYTYNGVMDAYGKNGMIRDMESVLSRMRSNKCKPDIISFNILIDSYGRKQEFEKMEQVFKSLLRSKEKPTLPTFNSMILNYGRARLKEKSEDIFKKMIDMRYTPNFITYESLITMYGFCDCVSRARETFDRLVGSGGETKVSTLNTMLDVYCMNG
ncbi:PPR domain-containing protein/PPR_2 domain-containing protein, partial [Cephalotus follicularis]